MGKKGVFALIGLLFVLLWLGFPMDVRAGGWNNTLLGCRAIAMGGAFAGLADDPSAIFYNPGGINFQRNNLNFSISGFYIWPTYEYTTGFGDVVKSRYNSPLPQFFLTYRTSEKVTLGFGFYVPYAGSGVDWRKEDIGFPLKSTLGVTSFSPTIAYQFSEELSLGLSLNLYHAVFDLNTETEASGPMTTDESGSSLSASLGFMFRPSERWSLGFTVRGPAKIKMEGLTAMDYGPYHLKFDSETVIRLPWDVEAGLSFRAGERIILAADAQYTFWSTLDKVTKVIKGIPYVGEMRFDEVMDFKNILIVRAGAEYAFPQGIFLRGGIGFDRYATPTESLSISNIDVDKVTLLGGLGIRSGKMQIDFAAAYGWGKEREQQSPIFFTTKYNLDVFIIGLGVTFSY